MDCFTDWPAIISLDRGTNALQVISAIRQSFCCTAIPDVVWSDGGPQFTSKVFKDFTKCWGFLHKVSSPRYPQSNGKVEAIVKSMKKLIRASWTGRSLDHDKLCRAILQYRNTPCRKDGLSPVQKLFGHPVQDILPATIDHSYLSGNAQFPQLTSNDKTPCNHLLPITTLMHTHYQT